MLSSCDALSMPRGKPKGKRLAAYVPEEIADSLESWAAEDNRSVSGLITNLLVRAVKEREQERLKEDG